MDKTCVNCKKPAPVRTIVGDQTWPSGKKEVKAVQFGVCDNCGVVRRTTVMTVVLIRKHRQMQQ